MLHSDTILFSRDNLDMYLGELAKEYRRQGGRSIAVISDPTVVPIAPTAVHMISQFNILPPYF